jgi:hypothetical protein
MILVEEGETRDEHVGGHDVDYVLSFVLVKSAEPDNGPECVQKDHEESLCGTGQEKVLGAGFQAHCCWTDLKIAGKLIRDTREPGSSILTESARILTIWNKPLIIPIPSPDTYAKICLL